MILATVDREPLTETQKLPSVKNALHYANIMTSKLSPALIIWASSFWFSNSWVQLESPLRYACCSRHKRFYSIAFTRIVSGMTLSNNLHVEHVSDKFLLFDTFVFSPRLWIGITTAPRKTSGTAASFSDRSNTMERGSHISYPHSFR